MAPPDRPRILCVDDEPDVLEGLTLNLRRRFEVATATGGVKGLELLESGKPFAVVISDMRMPGMDGAAFLRRAREHWPDTVRMLLTGQADFDSAVSAVNEGHLFRFLTKPCPPPALVAAVEAAVRQHELVMAERVLLEQTLHGSIKALIDVLALTNPVAFGRATRIRQLAADLAETLHLPDRWQLDVAAMLSQLGYISLPAETVERVYFGQPLSEAEVAMLDRVPALTTQLLAHIPRLEGVREILACARAPRKTPSDRAAEPPPVERAAEILRVAVDYDALDAQGSSAAHAMDTLQSRSGAYNAAVLAALSQVRTAGDRDEVRELPLRGLRAGMIVAEDVRMSSGTLLVTRGYEVTPGFVERVHNFRPGTVKDLIRVIVPRNGGSAA